MTDQQQFGADAEEGPDKSQEAQAHAALRRARKQLSALGDPPELTYQFHLAEAQVHAALAVAERLGGSDR